MGLGEDVSPYPSDATKDDACYTDLATLIGITLGYRWRCDFVQTTEYFQHVRQRPDRATIRDEWINHVLDHAERTEIQTDGRIRKWAKITAAGKVLRVILLADGQTVHNAFFDRSYKESKG